MRVQQTVVVSNPIGLHLRVAAQFVQTIKRFKSQVWIQRGSDLVDARSILCILQLAAVFGTQLNIVVDGEDAVDALSTILDFFHNASKNL